MFKGARSSRAATVAIVLGTLLGSAAVASAATQRGRAASLRSPGRAPARLADTGLYADAATLRVDPRNLSYVPQYSLWSDGASKRRWIHLPPGTAIDATDPEVWVFPVGTKFWKEFAWGSHRVETRYIERTRAGWLYATYAWREDGSEAVLAPESGLASAHEVAPGRKHVLPSTRDCQNCHEGGRARILGFGALQLSPDRDPLAPHASIERGEVLTISNLVARGLIRGLPRHVVEQPPRIAASTARGRAALGYLHANCGGCHDSVGPLASLGLALRHSLAARRPGDEPAAAAIGHPSRSGAAGVGPGGSSWIAPGAPSRSAVLVRMASRNPIIQMPPLGSQVVDDEAVALLRTWIEEELTGSVGEVGPQTMTGAPVGRSP